MDRWIVNFTIHFDKRLQELKQITDHILSFYELLIPKMIGSKESYYLPHWHFLEKNDIKIDQTFPCIVFYSKIDGIVCPLVMLYHSQPKNKMN